MSLHFHRLTIADVRRETSDCVSVAFEIPTALIPLFHFLPGQNITVRALVGAEDLRRSYSICSSPLESELRIAVKEVNGGKFSAWANKELRVGHVLEVLPPTGSFTINLSRADNFLTNPGQADNTLISPAQADNSLTSPTQADNIILHRGQTDNPLTPAIRRRNYLALAAGSGITPVLSMIKAVMEQEPLSGFTLVYGNRNRSSIIFREQLEALKNRFMNRFVIHHILSREPAEVEVYSGRIDAAKCEKMNEKLIRFNDMDDIFICGPEAMITDVRDWLLSKSIPPVKIHFELFTTPVSALPGTQLKPQGQPADIKVRGEISEVLVRIDGTDFTFSLPFDDKTILEAALSAGADLPFSCKGGVCSTCRAKLLEGKVEMELNYALEPEEVAAGFILCCQSRPTSPKVVIDFDSK